MKRRRSGRPPWRLKRPTRTRRSMKNGKSLTKSEKTAKKSSGEFKGLLGLSLEGALTDRRFSRLLSNWHTKMGFRGDKWGL